MVTVQHWTSIPNKRIILILAHLYSIIYLGLSYNFSYSKYCDNNDAQNYWRAVMWPRWFYRDNIVIAIIWPNTFHMLRCQNGFFCMLNFNSVQLVKLPNLRGQFDNYRFPRIVWTRTTPRTETYVVTTGLDQARI